MKVIRQIRVRDPTVCTKKSRVDLMMFNLSVDSDPIDKMSVRSRGVKSLISGGEDWLALKIDESEGEVLMDESEK